MLIHRSGFVVAKFSIEARQVNMRADFLFYGTPIFSNLPRPRKVRLNNTSHKWLTKLTLHIFLQGRYKGIPYMCVLLEPPTRKLPLPGTTYGPLRWVVNAATWWYQKGWSWTWTYMISWWNRHLKHSVVLMMLVKWMFVVVDFVCQFLYPPKKWFPLLR